MIRTAIYIELGLVPSHLKCQTMAPAQNEQIQVRLAYQNQDGCAYLYHLTVLRKDTGKQLMQKLRNTADSLIIPRSFLPFMWKIVLEKAEIDFVDEESQHTPMNVNLHNNTVDPILTRAFYDPSILCTAQKFVERDPALIVGRLPNAGIAGAAPRVRTIVVRRKLNLWAVFAILLLAFVLACGGGLLAGLLTRQVSVGVDTAAGILTFLGLGVVLVTALHKK